MENNMWRYGECWKTGL